MVGALFPSSSVEMPGQPTTQGVGDCDDALALLSGVHRREAHHAGPARRRGRSAPPYAAHYAVGGLQCFRRETTVSYTTAAPSSADWCSQKRSTSQPESARRASVSRSRWMLRSIFSRQ